MRPNIFLLFLFIAAVMLIGCGGRPGVTTTEASAASTQTSSTSSTAAASTPSISASNTISPTKLGTDAPGPKTTWMVVTLPNQAVTPGWQGAAPDDCRGDAAACAQDSR